MVFSSSLEFSMTKKRLKESRCVKCDFITSDMSNWKRHIKTRKHNDAQMMHEDAEEMHKGATTCEEKKKKWSCVCGKSYSYHQGYYRHKKTCKGKEETEKVKETLPSRGNNEMMDMVKNLMTQNQELMAKYTELATEIKELATENKELATENKELAKKNTELSEKNTELSDEHIATLKNENKNLQNNLNETIPRVGNITNNHNNIDVNVFLEEKCKDAMHLQEFGQLLRETTRLEDIDIYERSPGKAIGGIMNRELLKLAQVERPLHTYKKVWFIKDRYNGWEKDENGDFVEKIRLAVEGPLVYKCNTEKYADDYKAVDISAAQAKTMKKLLARIDDEKSRNAAKRVIRSTCTIK